MTTRSINLVATPRPGLRLRRSIDSPVGTGLIDGAAAIALYTRGWGRAFNLDASRTVVHFIAVQSWGAVFRQDRFNNHPLFSALEHLVYLATGSRSERILRLLPILCGAAVVALLAAAVRTRFGTAAGHIAGSTLAVNLLAVRQFREVRGYALVTLAAVASTLALAHLLDGALSDDQGSGPSPGTPRPPTRWRWTLGYLVALTVAIGSHLFACGLIPLHALLVASKGRRLRRWAILSAPAVAIGLAVQLPGILDGLSAPPRRAFDPGFPLALAANLLGGAALPGMLILVSAGWMELRRRRWAGSCACGALVLVGAAWAAAPVWLDSRFFVWLVPATGFAAGAAVARWPRLLPVAVLSVALQLAFLVPGLGRSELPNRTAAQLLSVGRSSGESVCALGRTGNALVAYFDNVPTAWNAADLGRCDLAVEADGPTPEPLLPVACARYAFVLPLPALHPGAAFVDRPPPQPPDPRAPRWTPTGNAHICRP